MRMLALVLVLGALAGCTGEGRRHGVVDPASAAGLSSTDWTVRQEPTPAPTP